MSKVRLTFEELKILRPKKRWRIYFVIATDDPKDATKMLLTSMPTPYIRMKPAMDNTLNFEPEGEDTSGDGLFILETDLPADNAVNVQVYLRHSRAIFRDTGSFLQDVQTELGADAFGIIGDALGSTGASWLSIAKKSAPLIGGILKKITDRDMGFVSMYEEFGPEFQTATELDRTNKFSTGDASITWTWSLEKS